jgi:23S rRNA (uracil747-C5)-methyltransferase
MNSFCSYFNEKICQSCNLITIDYSNQIAEKENILIKAFEKIEHPPLLNTVVSNQKKIRNKAKLSVTGTSENPILGLFGKENIDSGRELTNCPLHLDEINQMIPVIKDFIKFTNLSPYQIKTKTGELKGVIIFYSEGTQESYLRFILRSKESIDRIKKHQFFLTDKINHLKVISVNIQPIPHQIPEGDIEIYITNTKFISHRSSEIHFTLDPKAFVQTNQTVAEKLYACAAQWIQESKLKYFLELYCGQGAFSFYAAPFIEKGLGIEINPEAVKIANQTALKNKKHHLYFKCCDATKITSEIQNFSPDIILVNPPRRGLSESVQFLLSIKPKKIIYSSCNVNSLAEDLEKVTAAYRIQKIRIFDMFPNTKHFETLVELELKN